MNKVSLQTLFDYCEELLDSDITGNEYIKEEYERALLLNTSVVNICLKEAWFVGLGLNFITCVLDVNSKKIKILGFYATTDIFSNYLSLKTFLWATNISLYIQKVGTYFDADDLKLLVFNTDNLVNIDSKLVLYDTDWALRVKVIDEKSITKLYTNMISITGLKIEHLTFILGDYVITQQNYKLLDELIGLYLGIVKNRLDIYIARRADCAIGSNGVDPSFLNFVLPYKYESSKCKLHFYTD